HRRIRGIAIAGGGVRTNPDPRAPRGAPPAKTGLGRNAPRTGLVSLKAPNLGDAVVVEVEASLVAVPVDPEGVASVLASTLRELNVRVPEAEVVDRPRSLQARAGHPG